MMRSVLLLLVRIYQILFSPLKPTSCRFFPSCSQYAYDAIRIHGAAKGALMSLRRLGRCHPFHPGGYDPVYDPVIDRIHSQSPE